MSIPKRVSSSPAHQPESNNSRPRRKKLKNWQNITLLIISILFVGSIILLIFQSWFSTPFPFNQDDPLIVHKPVIYLYPEKVQETTVKLDYQGELIATYPDYDENLGGWQVTAYPDGKLINSADKLEYSYLFWEGQADEPRNWDLSAGFVVAGSDTREFLQETLSQMGLTPKEYNEFIVYWYPQLKDNSYNLIHFAGKEYTDTAPLEIQPRPDSMLRVFMVAKPLDQPVQIEKQEFEKFERSGFTVLEWGGTVVE